MTKPPIDISSLTTEEKLDLIEQLWNSLEDLPAALPEDQAAELDRRLDSLEAKLGARKEPDENWPDEDTQVRGRTDG